MALCIHTQIQLWWLLYYFLSIACVDSVGPHKHVNQDHSRVTRNERIRCGVDLKTPVCLCLSSLPAGICSRMWRAYMLCADRPLRFIILTGNPTAKCSRASSWKQGVKSCDWWVLCFTPSASQRVSSRGEDAPQNHYLKTYFSLLIWFRARPLLLVDCWYPACVCNTIHFNCWTIQQKLMQKVLESFLSNIKSSCFRTHH